jgi:hypothetical protein
MFNLAAEVRTYPSRSLRFPEDHSMSWRTPE